MKKWYLDSEQLLPLCNVILPDKVLNVCATQKRRGAYRPTKLYMHGLEMTSQIEKVRCTKLRVLALNVGLQGLLRLLNVKCNDICAALLHHTPFPLNPPTPCMYRNHLFKNLIKTTAAAAASNAGGVPPAQNPMAATILRLGWWAPHVFPAAAQRLGGAPPHA
jgi:hypothetical protein